MWTPDPDSVYKFRASGTGDMGDVTDPQSIARWGLSYDDGPAVSFVLVYLRVWFSGGTGVADMELKQAIASEQSGLFNNVIREFPDCGTDGQSFINERIEADDYPNWTFDAGDEIVFEWTNPNSGTMAWALEVGLAPIGQV